MRALTETFNQAWIGVASFASVKYFASMSEGVQLSSLLQLSLMVMLNLALFVFRYLNDRRTKRSERRIEDVIEERLKTFRAELLTELAELLPRQRRRAPKRVALDETTS
jgi:hypothetical protein